MITSFDEIRQRVEEVEGLITMIEAERLFNIIFRGPLDSVNLEIGSHLGKSSVAMGFACKDTKRKLYCIDVWHNDWIFEKWMAAIVKLGLLDNILPVRGYSGDILPTWLFKDKPILFDNVFIDGNHGMTDVLKDFVLVYPLVKVGGTIAFHDCNEAFPDVGKVWEIAKSLLSDHQITGSIASGRKLNIK